MISKEITKQTLFDCKNCGIKYHWIKSTSALKMTYCNFLCEMGDLGFTIEAFEKMEIQRAAIPEIEV